MGAWPSLTVEVSLPAASSGATDAHGNAVPGKPDEAEVAGVLPYPIGTADLESSRPQGAVARMGFHWPRSDHRILAGATISYGGRKWRVVGDPQPMPEAAVRGPWDRNVETEACIG